MTIEPNDAVGIVAFGLCFAWQLYIRTRQRQTTKCSQEKLVQDNSIHENSIAVGYEIPLSDTDRPLPRHVVVGADHFTFFSSSVTSAAHHLANCDERLDASWAIGAAPSISLIPSARDVTSIDQVEFDNAAAWLLEVEKMKETAITPLSNTRGSALYHGSLPSDACIPGNFAEVEIANIQCGDFMTVPFYVPRAEQQFQKQFDDNAEAVDNVETVVRKRDRLLNENCEWENESDGTSTLNETITSSFSSSRVRRRIERPSSLSSMAQRPVQFIAVEKRTTRRPGRQSSNHFDEATSARERRKKIVSEV
jgi:hypothetical protein